MVTIAFVRVGHDEREDTSTVFPQRSLPTNYIEGLVSRSGAIRGLEYDPLVDHFSVVPSVTERKGERGKHLRQWDIWRAKSWK